MAGPLRREKGKLFLIVIVNVSIRDVNQRREWNREKLGNIMKLFLNKGGENRLYIKAVVRKIYIIGFFSFMESSVVGLNRNRMLLFGQLLLSSEKLYK